MKKFIIVLSFFLILEISLKANHAKSDIDLNDPFYKLGWKNLDNPKDKTIEIPNANATIDIISTEIYLDEKEKILAYEEFTQGVGVNIDNIDYSLLIRDIDGYYNVYIQYYDANYVTSNSFKNVKSEDIINTISRRLNSQIKEIDWIDAPYTSENNVTSFGQKGTWNDDSITYEFRNLALGKLGYIDTTMSNDGYADDTDEIINFYSTVSRELGNTISFKENFKYTDYKLGDEVALYNLSNIIDGSFGTNYATEKTISYAYCLISKKNLVGELNEDDHSRFAGKEIIFLISSITNKIYDISDDEGVSVMSGMYGGTDAPKFTMTGNNLYYNNTIDLIGETEDDKVKYTYKNKILFDKNQKPTLLYLDIDQQGLSFNKWKLRISCRDNRHTSEEKKIASLYKNNKKISQEVIKKIMERKKTP